MKVEIGPYLNNDEEGERHIEIRIDEYDTWSADHTLALVIHPLLLKLKDDKKGAPWVDDKDVPEEIRSTSAKPKENEWDTDNFFFERWNWVLDEMIWAFAQVIADDNYFNLTLAQMEAHDKRKQRAFELFGKYYQALWT